MEYLEFNVSVVVPVYNASRYVKRAVESAIQIDDVKELILIDDGSTDNSFEICQQLELKHAKVTLLHHPGRINLGAAASRNLGIQNSKYDFIAFLDADDYYLPNRFESDKKIFSKFPDADGSYGCNLELFQSERAKELYFAKRSSELTAVTETILPEKLYRCILFGGFGEFHTSTITLKKRVFEKTGLFNTNIRYVEDTELWLKLAVSCRLYTGNIIEPQSVRIVHEENSIHEWDKIKPFKDLMHQSVFDWVLTQPVEFSVMNDFFTSLFYHFRDRYKTAGHLLWKQLLRNPALIFSSFFYKKLHLLLQG
jgi:glycosyltransferase involved in cell wall biosynthesis